METTKITGVRVYNGLQSMIVELGRVTKTGGYHFDIKSKDGVIEILHHNYKWIVKVSPRRIVILTDEDVLTIDDEKMELNGRQIDSICDTVQCLKREQIICRIMTAIATWYSGITWLADWSE